MINYNINYLYILESFSLLRSTIMALNLFCFYLNGIPNHCYKLKAVYIDGHNDLRPAKWPIK